MKEQKFCDMNITEMYDNRKKCGERSTLWIEVIPKKIDLISLELGLVLGEAIISGDIEVVEAFIENKDKIKVYANENIKSIIKRIGSDEFINNINNDALKEKYIKIGELMKDYYKLYQ
jgi:hypothetical protein